MPRQSRGAIPSNVMPDSGKASYGSLAGRVDATTWWLIATAIYARHSQDQQFLKMIPHVHKAFWCLACLGVQRTASFVHTTEWRNWADEYPLHGYLLVRQLLAIVGAQSLGVAPWFSRIKWKSVAVSTIITQNFGRQRGGKFVPSQVTDFECTGIFGLPVFTLEVVMMVFLMLPAMLFAILLGLVTSKK